MLGTSTIASLENRLDKIERSMGKNIQILGNSMQAITRLMEELQKENIYLKKDIDFLIRSYDKLNQNLREYETSETIKKIFDPIKVEIIEDFNLIKSAAMDGFLNKRNDLMKLIRHNNGMTVHEYAQKLGVHRIQIESWIDDINKNTKEKINIKDGKIFLGK